jgi:hypothetical protein
VFNGTNLGIGVTPSANWTASGSQKALQLGEYAALSGSGVGGSYYQTVLGLNCVDHTTGTKYLNNGYATAYIQDTGRHYWNIAGVGTAGNAVSFTSAMFLTEAGRLGIATTTPTSLLSVGTLGTTSAPAITIGSAINSTGSLYFGDGTGADTYRGYIEYTHSSDSLAIGTAGTERVVVNSSGQLGIGTSTFATNSKFAVQTSTCKLDIVPEGGSSIKLLAGSGGMTLSAPSGFFFETGSTQQFEARDLQLYSNGTIKATTSISVGNAVPTTSGAGITFPATQSASSNANTLDDYEEGTWTPSDGSGAGLSLTVSNATYTKIGRMVYASALVTYPVTADTSQAKLASLPFAVGTVPGTGVPNMPLTSGSLQIQINVKSINNAEIDIYPTAAGVTNAQLSGVSFIAFTLIYPSS